MFYSLRKAITGSFLAALRDGIMPEYIVSTTLIAINIIAAGKGRTAFKFESPVRFSKIMLIGIHIK